jgi:hypothetical protein
MVFWMSTASTTSKSPDWTRSLIVQALRMRPAAPSSTLPSDLSLGAVLGSLTRAFCAASKPPRWDRCRALGFDCFGEGLEARRLIDSAALMSACFQAKRLASNLDLISSSGSLQVQLGISGLGHKRSFGSFHFQASPLALRRTTSVVFLQCERSRGSRTDRARLSPAGRFRVSKSIGTLGWCCMQPTKAPPEPLTTPTTAAPSRPAPMPCRRRQPMPPPRPRAQSRRRR